jgi:[ribosomal protein S5]-alanine N-acetyltransferase
VPPGLDTTLSTDRLLLRPFQEQDYEAVHAYASDPDVTRYTSFGPNSPDETREFLRRSLENIHQEPRRQYLFAVVLKEDDRLIGGTGLAVSADEPRIAELGFVLHRDAWGQGYAAEAARTLIDFGFEQLGLNRIYACYHPDNRASARVMEKIGMRYEGLLRECVFLKGSWWDFGQYAMIARDWSQATLRAKEA